MGELAHLSPQVFEQAQAVLDRERLSARELFLFHLLRQFVWAAVALTGLYVFLRVRVNLDPGELKFVAWAVAALYIAIVPLLIMNSRVVAKLWRTARFQNSLEPVWERRLKDLVRRHRSRHPVEYVTTLLLIVLFGLPALIVGAGGLLLELTGEASVEGITIAVVGIMFGLSCLLLRFTAIGRDRLEALEELRASLRNSRTTGSEDRQVPGRVYDAIARLQRQQLAEDRQRVIASITETGLRRRYSSREHRSVRNTRVALSSEAALRVQACIDTLTLSPSDCQPSRVVDNVSFLPVEGTSLEIGFTVDHEAREIRILSMTETGANDLATAHGEREQ
jgi:hypothetical protein